MKLTKAERLILANQYRILAHLDSQDAKSYERHVEALESGFESAIEALFSSIFDGIDSRDCSLVVRAMALYDALQRSQKNLAEGAGVSTEDVRFPGFDGNNETEYMAYARYVVEREERFTYLEPVGGSFNSHMPFVERYRAMLREWKEMGESYDLSENQIKRLLNSR